ncbi:hypothetical protein BST22_11715 [Mycolicibacterium chubuense]|jgi:hypothetical protein|uniref:Proline rich protein n=1 Tax=Mycolicibacterium chubuense TaxID=1800 RepID=A0A0J6VQ25_MYCCU|nr:hypothetical protein [Mycolicibacterium chubuense]KMO71548.1 hypothetical protein MCHUDSM44219_05177 [Mycolicibacterium chubuense]ORA52739.1 hypothetical protein BST22_11715 [Mycolicibacterium chubuense]SPX98394.1 Uncharacterised protein [Mycolicibacterium chubuense]
MSEPTPPPHDQTPHDQTEPATGPVLTPPAAYQGPPPVPPQPVYVERSSRLNKAAAWVGIVAGSLFIVVVIFGAGFLTGKAVSNGHRGDYDRGHEMMMRPGPAMFPMGPPGGMQRGPSFPGPFGPGQIIEIPRPPGGAPSAPDTPAPARP